MLKNIYDKDWADIAGTLLMVAAGVLIVSAFWAWQRTDQSDDTHRLTEAVPSLTEAQSKQMIRLNNYKSDKRDVGVKDGVAVRNNIRIDVYINARAAGASHTEAIAIVKKFRRLPQRYTRIKQAGTTDSQILGALRRGANVKRYAQFRDRKQGHEQAISLVEQGR